jgi:hypothetical protein
VVYRNGEILNLAQFPLAAHNLAGIKLLFLFLIVVIIATAA